MNPISFTDIGLPKKFQPDLSNSPLNNDIRTRLSEKIKQMHCQECISKGYKSQDHGEQKGKGPLLCRRGA